MNLKQIEKKAWRSQFIDGSADIGIGLLIVIATFFRFNPDISYYYWILMLLPVLPIFLIKKYITTPRIGLVKFSKERIRKDRLFILIAAIILAIVFSAIFLIIATKKEWIQAIPYPMVIAAAALFLVWSSIAYFRDFPRLYPYAFLAGISIILTGTNVQNNLLGMAAWYLTSIVMIVIGIILFVKFLKKYKLR